MDIFPKWSKIEKKIRFIITQALILYEASEGVSILELYNKYLHSQELTESELNILKSFDNLCYYQAIYPIVDNPIAKGELVLDNEEDL
jgi:hypothetical protein